MATMTHQEITQKVIARVAQSLAIEESKISENSLLITELGADSLDIMDIMFAMEEEFSLVMDKSFFNFLGHIDMPREEAVNGEFLTPKGKKALKEWMPSLDESQDIKPSDLAQYLSIFSLVKAIEKESAQ